MSQPSRYRLGIDIGGTFTDFTLIDAETRSATSLKVPTVPAHPERGIENGLRILRDEQGLDLAEAQYFVHGMTIGLNTLLQRRGSKIALLVTEGFRDMLTLQRLRLPVPYDLASRLPEPLVPRNLVFGIRERLDASGRELAPLDRSSVEKAADQAVLEGVEGIAICFLHSYRDPAHETEAARIIADRHPQLKTCCSSELWPEMREYERACIATTNLYIQKNVEEYFSNLERILDNEGLATRPFITQSNGGIQDLRSAAHAPVKTLFSGPAAGVIGAVETCAAAGRGDLLTFDMGGTSTDVSLVTNGKPTLSSTSELAGIPVVMPAIDIQSIGAGGGSIAWIDAGGLLKVGPESAGSDPGPACYGKSMLPTLTDAFLVSGYLNPGHFAAGRMALDGKRSRDAIAPLAAQLGKSIEETADAMVRIAAANMYAELSNIMEQKGFDPRELEIVAFGGGGPVVANIVAEEINARGVFVPRRPGTLCAQGALSADFAYDATSNVQLTLNESAPEQIDDELASLESKARAWLAEQNAAVLEGAKASVAFIADAHYDGQAYQLPIPINRAELKAHGYAALVAAFNEKHQRLYGHAEEHATVRIARLSARITAKPPELAGGGKADRHASAEASPDESSHALPGAKPISTRTIRHNGELQKADVFDRDALAPKDRISGPAIIEQDDTTTLVLPNWFATCDENCNLIIARSTREL